MIKKLILVLLLISPAVSYAQEFNWKSAYIVENYPKIKIYSTYNYNEKQIRRIKGYFDHLSIEFFKYDGLNPKLCWMKPLTIKIISEADINNKTIFPKISGVVFGRYFKSNDTIFLTPEFFKRRDYLAHEMAHYFYDQCNLIFKDEAEEEVSAYEFQRSVR